MGAGRAPLIIAGVAALVTYAVLGEQTPFGFLHRLGLGGHRHTVTINTDKSDDIADAARDAADSARDKAEEERDRAQEMRDRAQELAENGKELAQADAEKAKAAVIAAIPPVPPVPPVPVVPPVPTVPGESTEVRTLAPFDAITIENIADVTVTIGDTQSVMLTGEVGHTETGVHDGKLVVSGSTPGVRVAIIVPHLRALQVNGYGKVSLVGLRDPIAIKANGAAEIWGSGAVDSAELTLNGPSKFALAKLEAKTLVIQINGVGDADVNATDTLIADVKGIGHVSYRGSPHLVTSIKGPGSVQHAASTEG